MPSKINLLPKAPQRSKEVEKAIGWVQSATYFVVIIFIIVGPIMGFFIYRFTRELNSLQDQNKILRTSITNLESTEQGLVLLKDRVEKIQSLLVQRQSFTIHAKQADIVTSLPSGLAFKKVNLGNTESNIEIESTSSQALAGFLRKLSTSDKYTSLILSNLSYNPVLGYSFEIQAF